MTPPTDKPESAWSRLSGIWFAVNLGIPFLETVALSRHKGIVDGQIPFTGYFILALPPLLVVSNIPLAWLLSKRRLGLCLLIFLGSLFFASALMCAGLIMMFSQRDFQ
jgi:hypothetical protein